MGGSMVGSMSTFTDLAISKNDYEDKGDNKYALALEKTFWFL